MITSQEVEAIVIKLRTKKLVVAFDVTGAPVVVTHGLNRVPERIALTNVDSNCNVWYSDINSKTLTAHCSISAIVNITLEVS